jgi:phosphoenolpyruvate---glycerone phosphotransferase subunit DhaL
MRRELTADDLIREMQLMAAVLEESRDELCRLDGLIGDGDHGLAMSEGFAAVAKAAFALDPASATLADVFNVSAKAFLNAVGASSGPLYATAFMHAAKVAGARARMPIEETPRIVVAMADGVRARGKAEIGEKTMVDAWSKAAEAAERGLAEGRALPLILEGVRDAAREGAEATKSMTAGKGRAARLGDRSLGHIDPGAASAALIVDAWVNDWIAQYSAR